MQNRIPQAPQIVGWETWRTKKLARLGGDPCCLITASIEEVGFNGTLKKSMYVKIFAKSKNMRRYHRRDNKKFGKAERGNLKEGDSGLQYLYAWGHAVRSEKRRY